MARYFLELAYKGTEYSGFQVQENAMTVQEVVEKALLTVFRRQFSLTGSSRTDAGVHARQNYFHFDSEETVEQRSVYNLNAVLPDDIAVKGIFPVPAEAHCRFDAVSREYKYLVYSRKDPFLEGFAWRYPYPLDLENLRAWASVAAEYRDFTSFSKRNTQVRTFDCTIMESDWSREGDLLVYRVKANRFLRGMVRGLVGTMVRGVRAGEGPDHFREVVEGKNPRLADFSTPPQGLYLEKVNYPADLEAFLR